MTVRLGGMASSLDTESIIKAMIDAKSVPITALTEKITAQEDLYSAWSTIDTSMSVLQSSSTLLTNFSTWSQMTFSSNNEDVVTGAVTGTSVGEKEFNVTVSNLARAHQYKSNSQTSTTTALGYSGEFTVNGQTITVETADTLTSLAKKINDKSTSMTGVGASASIIGNSLVLASKKTGTDNVMTVAYSSGDNVLSLLGMNDVANETTALNMKGKINNVDVESATNTGVTSLVSGMTFNFKAAGTTTVNTAHDTSNIKTMIKDFIANYNSTMANLAEQTKVTVSSTASTVSSTGVLQGDTLANKIQSKGRSILTSANTDPALMDQDFNSLNSVGIWFEDETNEISITDEDKLDDALANNFDEVMALFRSYGTNGKGQGIFRQFTTFVNEQTDGTTGTIVTKENTLTEQITANTLKKAKLKSNIADYEVDLWQHFAQMESSVSKINSASTYLLKSLGVSTSS